MAGLQATMLQHTRMFQWLEAKVEATADVRANTLVVAAAQTAAAAAAPAPNAAGSPSETLGDLAP